MLHILRAGDSPSFGQGPFRIRRIRPGAAMGPDQDPAFGPFSIMDHANLGVGTVVGMHEHRNDEILSYMWRGTMLHEDSTGQTTPISPRRLMMMNAGKSFWHEESTPDGPVEMLQIFIRPQDADLPGEVQFHERPEEPLAGNWTLLAGPEGNGAPLVIRQEVAFHDVHLRAGDVIDVPQAAGRSQWLYVMDGEVALAGETLRKGDAATDGAATLPPITAIKPTTLVLFLVDRQARATLAGTISGR